MAHNDALLTPYRLGRQSVYRAVEGLAQADAVWKPARHVKSIQETLIHLGGAERFWLTTLGRGTLDFPEDDGLDVAEAFLRAMQGVVEGHVAAADEAELVRAQTTERGELSLAWMVKRVTQHMFYHLGTLVYLRACRQPDWHGDAGLRHWQAAADAFSALIPAPD